MLKHHAVKAYGGVEVMLRALSVMAVDGSEWLALCCGHVISHTQPSRPQNAHLLFDPLKQQHDGVHNSGC